MLSFLVGILLIIIVVGCAILLTIVAIINLLTTQRLHGLIKALSYSMLLVFAFVLVSNSVVLGDFLPLFAQDSQGQYYLYSLMLLVILAVLLFKINSMFLGYISKTHHKYPLTISFLLVLLYAGLTFITASLALYNLVGTGEIYPYPYCGKEFNEKYREAVINKDPTVCLDDASYSSLSTSADFKMHEFCFTPTRRYMSINYTREESNPHVYLRDMEDIKANCVSAMARDLHDVQTCELIRDNNLKDKYFYDTSPNPGDTKACLYFYNRDIGQ